MNATQTRANDVVAVFADRGDLVHSSHPLWKRCIDLVIALPALALMSPLFVVTAVYIKVTSPGPVFFRHARYGAGGCPFRMWKFRTMSAATDPVEHHDHVLALLRTNAPLEKMDEGRRLIPGGKWLRRLGIDELPQLLNVVAGEMSLVGPRPDVVAPEHFLPEQRQRFQVVPGITGLWQVSGKNRTTFQRMLQLDAEYVRARSVWLDGKILFVTPFHVLKHCFQPD